MCSAWTQRIKYTHTTKLFGRHPRQRTQTIRICLVQSFSKRTNDKQIYVSWLTENKNNNSCQCVKVKLLIGVRKMTCLELSAFSNTLTLVIAKHSEAFEWLEPNFRLHFTLFFYYHAHYTNQMKTFCLCC